MTIKKIVLAIILIIIIISFSYINSYKAIELIENRKEKAKSDTPHIGSLIVS
jgi:hypothetical protein